MQDFKRSVESQPDFEEPEQNDSNTPTETVPPRETDPIETKGLAPNLARTPPTLEKTDSFIAHEEPADPIEIQEFEPSRNYGPAPE